MIFVDGNENIQGNIELIIFKQNDSWVCQCVSMDIAGLSDDKHKAYDEFIKNLIKASFWYDNMTNDEHKFGPNLATEEHRKLYEKGRVIRETDFLKIRILEE